MAESEGTGSNQDGFCCFGSAGERDNGFVVVGKSTLRALRVGFGLPVTRRLPLSLSPVSAVCDVFVAGTRRSAAIREADSV